MTRKLHLLMILTLTTLLATACVQRLRVGPTQTDSETVELGDATSARIDIDMGVGELEIGGGADDLMTADFTYNVAEWQPEVSYRVANDEGRLTVRQPDGDLGATGIPDDEIRYQWDIKLNESVPMNLDISLGVGDSELSLGDLFLTNLDIQTGVGKTVIDLTGDWRESVDVSIEGGVGSTTVYLPDNVGVRVVTSTGVGTVNVNGLIRNGDTYTNSAYDESDIVLDIDVEGGVGTIDLQLQQ